MPQRSNPTLDEKLSEMGLSLPLMPTPTGNYASFVFVPPFLYISGVTPKVNGKLVHKGKVGRDVSKEEAYQAAKQCILLQLSIAKSAIGDLERIEQVVKIAGFVNTDGNFTELPAVMNGASDLLVELLGERGRHARSAVGVASLPGDAPVEVEMIVKVN